MVALAQLEIGENALATGHPEAAKTQAKAALSYLSSAEAGLNEIQGLILLSQAEHLLGNGKRASHLTEQVMEKVAAITYDWHPVKYYELLDAIAEGLIRNDQYELAYSNLIRSVEVKERLRRHSEGIARRDYLALQIQTYQRLLASLVETGRGEMAFKVAEISRAKMLAESLGEGDLQPELLSPSRIQRQMRDGQAIVYYANTDTPRPIVFLLTNSGFKARVLEVGTALKQIREKYQDNIQSVLAEQAGAFSSDSSLTGKTDVGDTNALYQISTYYRHLLQQPNPADLPVIREIGRALDEALIAPLADDIGKRSQLLVLADGILNFLPFESLTDRSGKYLVEGFDISYIQSLSVLTMLNQRTYGDGRRPMLALGGAIYSETTYAQDMSRGAVQLASLDRGGLYRKVNGNAIGNLFSEIGIDSWVNLPGTLAEVNDISKIVAGARVLTGRDVNEPRVKSLSRSGELAQYKVLHFATHGIVTPTIPEMSSIVLSQSASAKGSDDGYLSMTEIAKLSIKADFVNLSACQTGLGRIYGGEGVVGLTQAFMVAGANGMSVSLWEVSDASTKEFMTGLYRLVNENDLTYSDAMNAMKRRFISGGGVNGISLIRRGVTVDIAPKKMAKPISPLVSLPASYAHPYFWAAFVYYGNDNWRSTRGASAIGRGC